MHFCFTWKRLSLLTGGAVDLGISTPSLPSFTAPLIGLLDTTSDGGAFTVFGGVSSFSSLRSSSAGREESQDRSLFSLVGERHSSGGKVTYGATISCDRQSGYFANIFGRNAKELSQHLVTRVKVDFHLRNSLWVIRQLVGNVDQLLHQDPPVLLCQ